MIKVNSSLRIAVIDNCNFDCLYCPREENMENYCPKNIRNKKLNTEKFIKVIEDILNNYEFTKIVITGGEPLLCPDLEQILKSIKNYKNMVELDTNGSLFTLNRWKKIRPYIDGVKVSLDSLNEEHFNYLTNCKIKNGLQNAIELIKEVKSSGMPVTINCVCTKINFNATNCLTAENAFKQFGFGTSGVDVVIGANVTQASQ